MKLVIHIGGAKCGSSSIQHFLAHNHAYLTKRGVFSPDVNMKVGEQYWGNQLWFYEKAAAVPPLLKAIRPLAHIDNMHTVVLSGENLTNYRNLAFEFKRQADVYKDIKIVMYIRRQDDFFISAWQQWGAKLSFGIHEWMGNHAGAFGNWWLQLQTWIQAFGKENVLVRRLPMDTVKDFAGILGINPLGLVCDKVNPSIDENLVEIGAELGLFKNKHDTLYYDFLRRELGQDALKKQTGSQLLTLKQRRNLLAFYREPNDLLRDVFFPSDDSLFPEPTEADVVKISEIQRLRRQNRLLKRLVIKFYDLRKNANA